VNITGIGVRKTNPTIVDSDDDGLSDYEEAMVYKTDPTLGDTDGDSLSDGFEVELGGDPRAIDSDGDGLNDGEECALGTSINNEDSDGDGLSDYYEIKVRMTDPNRSDSDGDGIPDKYDYVFPTTPDWYLWIVVILFVLLYRAVSRGTFRNWRKDIIAFGLSDAGGIPAFVIPEDFGAKYDASLISSGLMGIHTMTGEISGRELESLVLSGEIPIFINKKTNSIIWVFIRKEYPKIINKLRDIHKEIEEKYGELLASWSGLAEEVEEIKMWVASKIGLSPEMETIEAEETETLSELEKEFKETFGE